MMDASRILGGQLARGRCTILTLLRDDGQTMMKSLAVDTEEYYSLDIDDTEPGRFFIGFPVSNPYVDYCEWYEIDEITSKKYQNDLKSALPFVIECKNHLHDDLLLLKPGRMRGTPWWGKTKS